MASQFDIHATLLAAAGYADSITSFGNNLLDSSITGKYVFSKKGSNMYQVMDSNHVLGFNAFNNKAEYLYDYKKDMLLIKNLIADKNAAQTANVLLSRIKAFLQKTALQYNANTHK